MAQYTLETSLGTLSIRIDGAMFLGVGLICYWWLVSFYWTTIFGCVCRS